jgi:Tfp pilus assembly protein PilX
MILASIQAGIVGQGPMLRIQVAGEAAEQSGGLLRNVQALNEESMRKARRRFRRGYALVLSMMLIVILSAFATALYGLAHTSRRTAAHREEGAQALHLAIGGLDHAVAALKEDPAYTGFSACTLGPGTVGVTVTTPPGQPDRREVVSTGTVAGRGYTTERRVRAIVNAASVSSVFYKALAAKQSFGINGNVTVNSSPALNQGDIHSNGNITLSGSAMLVAGAATASGTISTSGSPTVTGGMSSGVPPMTFPEITAAFKEQALVNGTTPSSLTVNDGRLVQGKINGNLTVSGLGCRITGVVWVTGNLTISGPVTGTGTLVCDGTISLDSRFNYPATSLANIAFMTSSTSSTAVSLGGNRQFKGLIYAPYGGVRLHGTPALLGSILANTITFSGNPQVTRWTQFDSSPPPLPSSFQVEGWQEI